MPNDEDPWLLVQPDWISLASAPEIIQKCFGVPWQEVVNPLISAIRNSEIRHRVIGLALRLSSRLPAGFEMNRDCVVVTNWDVAGVDWRTGTVAGWTADERKSIELHWLGVQRWSQEERMVWHAAERRRKRLAQVPYPVAPASSEPIVDRPMISPKAEQQQPEQANELPRGYSTTKEASAEQACVVWLRNLKQYPGTKLKARDQAKVAVAHIGTLSDKAFARAWASDAKPEWKKPGAKPKPKPE